MTANHRSISTSGLTLRSDQPLIGVVLIEDGQEVVRYFSDENEADAVVAAQASSNVRDLAGVWSDLDWEKMVAELDQIRHESTPTPPMVNCNGMLT